MFAFRRLGRGVGDGTGSGACRRREGITEIGGFAKNSFRMVALDSLSEDYLLTRALATHKTPTEIIGELVRKEIAQAV